MRNGFNFLKYLADNLPPKNHFVGSNISCNPFFQKSVSTLIITSSISKCMEGDKNEEMKEKEGREEERGKIRKTQEWKNN